MLTDLESITERVREPDSRTYVREAIAAYQAGAFRSAVIATWIAVVFDSTLKLRELAAQESGWARDEINKIDKAIESQNTPVLQTFEKDLIEFLHTNQLVSARGATDLRRLYEDRNACAHPAFHDAAMLYQPSPESVRAHLVGSVEHLLSQSPRQGRALVEWFFHQLSSPSLPTDPEHLERFIHLRFIDRAREGALTMLSSCIFKWLVLQTEPSLEKQERLLVQVAQIIYAARPGRFREGVEREMGKHPPLSEEQIPRLMYVVSAVPASFDWLNEADQLKFRAIVQKWEGVPKPLPPMEFAPAALKSAAEDAFERYRTDDWRSGRALEIAACFRDDKFVDPCIELFGESGGWREAESRASRLLQVLRRRDSLTTGRLDRILELAGGNSQIWDASKMPELFERLWHLSDPDDAHQLSSWRKFLADVQVDRFDRLLDLVGSDDADSEE